MLKATNEPRFKEVGKRSEDVRQKIKKKWDFTAYA